MTMLGCENRSAFDLGVMLLSVRRDGTDSRPRTSESILPHLEILLSVRGNQNGRVFSNDTSPGSIQGVEGFEFRPS